MAPPPAPAHDQPGGFGEAALAAVQLGTAFAACWESASTPAWRAAVRSAVTGDTTLSDMVSGNPARARRTRYIEATRGGPRAPDFPAMYALHGPLREAARAAGSEDFEVLLYGQGAPLAREAGAGDLMAALIEEARAAMAGLAPAR